MYDKLCQPTQKHLPLYRAGMKWNLITSGQQYGVVKFSTMLYSLVTLSDLKLGKLPTTYPQTWKM